jgi:hypothetical protein
MQIKLVWINSPKYDSLGEGGNGSQINDQWGDHDLGKKKNTQGAYTKWSMKELTETQE